MQEHERFLIKFTNLFKSVDRDQDGVISEVQFTELLRFMNVLQDEDEIESLLHQVDPFNNKKMTFSEVVDSLSNHMVPRDPLNPSPHNQIALIEKFIQEGDDVDINDYAGYQAVDQPVRNHDINPVDSGGLQDV